MRGRTKAATGSWISRVRAFVRRHESPYGWRETEIRRLAGEAEHLLGKTCLVCERLIERIGLDHKIPVARGGRTIPGNIRAMHEECNRAKGALTEDEFVRLIVALDSIGLTVKRDVLARLKAGWRAGGSAWRLGARRFFGRR